MTINSEVNFSDLKRGDIFYIKSVPKFGKMKVIRTNINLKGKKEFLISLPDRSEIIIDESHYIYKHKMILEKRNFKNKKSPINKVA